MPQMNSNLSALIQTCHAIFNDDPMNWLSLPHLEHQLSSMQAEDFGVPLRMHNLTRTSGWDCVDLYDSPNFHIGMIIVPEGSELPIHDHPEMMVLTRVVWGHLRFETFDWAQEYPMSGIARRHQPQICHGASPVRTLWPKSHNMHRIRALSDAAFIDIFSPWYNEDRICRYYRESEDLSNGLVRLECTS